MSCKLGENAAAHAMQRLCSLRAITHLLFYRANVSQRCPTDLPIREGQGTPLHVIDRFVMSTSLACRHVEVVIQYHTQQIPPKRIIIIDFALRFPPRPPYCLPVVPFPSQHHRMACRSFHPAPTPAATVINFHSRFQPRSFS